MGPLGPAEFIGLVAYGGLWSVLALSLASAAFRRRPL
jgi:hypothetical protein